MDPSFWLGIICGALVGMPFSIAANLWTDPIRAFIDRRRTIRYSSQKSSELEQYRFAEALREGDPTATLIFGIDRAFSIRLVVQSSTLLLGMGVFVVLRFAAASYIAPLTFKIALCILAAPTVWFLLQSYTSAFRLQQIKSRLAGFDEYERIIHERWGEEFTQQT
jgi:hypothetical protein